MLAFTLAKHKMPFSACDAFTSFAKAADPDLVWFKNVVGSRNTITCKIYEKIIRPELTAMVSSSHY
jgi:hypothetical protein